MRAVTSVSFSVEPGEILCILGESGSGKTTLIRAALGQLGHGGYVVEGDIQYKGQSLLRLKRKQRRELWGSALSYIPQDCATSFMPIKKIGEQICDTLLSHQHMRRKAVYAHAGAMMHSMGISDPVRILNSYPFELSGGLIQRVGISLAFLAHPTIVFADEPTSALDYKSREQCMEVILEQCKQEDTSCVMVTHNIDMARSVAQKFLVLDQGRVVDYGSAKEVFDDDPKEIVTQLVKAAHIAQWVY